MAILLKEKKLQEVVNRALAENPDWDRQECTRELREHWTPGVPWLDQNEQKAMLKKLQDFF